ncbi:unnamed protein product [Prunus armeniaca]
MNFPSSRKYENVGIQNSFNGPRQGGRNVSGIRVVARESAKNVGIQGVGNTNADLTKAPVGAASYSLGAEEAEPKLA